MIRTSQAIDAKLRAMATLLRKRGRPVTHQRLAVYRCLLEDEGHPDAERLFVRVRREVPTISLGTVYKTLDTLKELGAIMEVDSPRSATRYEAVLEPHHHLLCERCGWILDLYEKRYSKPRLPRSASEGFEVTSCTVQFRGECPECAASRGKNQKNRRSKAARTKEV